LTGKKIYHWGFTIPALAFYILFFILPVMLNFYYSLTDWNAIRLTNEIENFVGLKNFQKIFTVKELSSIITRTMVFGFVTTIFKNFIGFFLALLFSGEIKSKNALRAIFFLPSMLPPLIIGLIFGSLLMTNGFVNKLLEGIGLESLVKPWLTTKSTAFGAVAAVEIWRQTGFNMVIYIAGLQLIDKAYYEAASIDGASAWQKLVYVTLPRMLPAISINLLLNLSQGLKAFDIVYVLTGGGPSGSTELINTMVFKEFGKKLYGMSAAYGVIMFVITAVFGLISLMFTSRQTDE